MNIDFKEIANKVKQADAILITAGAGIGVDSGLPDFRGNHGFWNHYPPFKKLGLSFIDLANPRWFSTNPELAWGFYGHRLNLYRKTIPHKGFEILLKWALNKNNNYFVFTSNVDGQFQKAGFDVNRIYEVHGSIHYLQCLNNCSQNVWFNDENVEVDNKTMTAKPPLPKCIKCGAVARPNILMFSDWGWNGLRYDAQEERLRNWIDKNINKEIVVIEIGAGTGVPTVRYFSERFSRERKSYLIRINLRESFCDLENSYSLPLSSLEALQNIDNNF